MDRQWFSLSKASQLVQKCEDRLSATDSAPHRDRLFHMVRADNDSIDYNDDNIFTESAMRLIQPSSHKICDFVCPLANLDWRLLVEECITNIGLPLEGCVILPFIIIFFAF